MKYDPSIDNLPEPNLPHFHLEDLIIEALLLDDHGEMVIGDRALPPQLIKES